MLALLGLGLVLAPLAARALPPVICTAPIFTGTPPNITAITPGTLVQGLLVDNNNGTAVLDSEGSGGRLFFQDGTIGAYLGECTPYFLNIGTSEFSYKPLSWTHDEVDHIWKANFSSIIKAEKTNTYAPTVEFLACKPVSSGGPAPWELYLQTGTDKPPVHACETTKLYVSANTLHPVGTTD